MPGLQFGNHLLGTRCSTEKKSPAHLECWLLKNPCLRNLNMYPLLPQPSLRSRSRTEVTAGKVSNAYPSQGRDSQLLGTRGKKRGEAWSL